MFKHLFVVAVATALALPATVAVASPSKDCVLDQVVAVHPLTVQRSDSKFGPMQRLVGAALTIPAQPGLTTDWLKRLADVHAERMTHGTAMADCVFGVPNSLIDVSSNGSGFLTVNVRSDNLDGAREILRRAEAMAR